MTGLGLSQPGSAKKEIADPDWVDLGGFGLFSVQCSSFGLFLVFWVFFGFFLVFGYFWS
jgi:hypothetical protein